MRREGEREREEWGGKGEREGRE
jgi:hypothetical protein